MQRPKSGQELKLFLSYCSSALNDNSHVICRSQGELSLFDKLLALFQDHGLDIQEAYFKYYVDNGENLIAPFNRFDNASYTREMMYYLINGYVIDGPGADFSSFESNKIYYCKSYVEDIEDMVVITDEQYAYTFTSENKSFLTDRMKIREINDSFLRISPSQMAVVVDESSIISLDKIKERIVFLKNQNQKVL